MLQNEYFVAKLGFDTKKRASTRFAIFGWKNGIKYGRMRPYSAAKKLAGSHSQQDHGHHVDVDEQHSAGPGRFFIEARD